MRNLLYLLFQESLLHHQLQKGTSNAVQAQIASAVSEDPPGAVQEPITPPTVATEVFPNAGEPELSLEIAKQLMAVYLQWGYDVPDNINDIVNPKDLDQNFDNALKHEFWKNNAIPVYDVDKSHMPSDVELDPSNPDSFLTFSGEMKI